MSKQKTSDAKTYGKSSGDIKDIAGKVMQYLQDKYGDIDKKQLVVYVAIATVALYGMRKSGVLASVVLPFALAMVTKVKENAKVTLA